MLCLEVEFLTGVSVAATPDARDRAEWPPHPDRLFQALVAAWGRQEEPDDGERRALEWLEGLDRGVLTVRAPAAHTRDVATVFVPPNDARTTSKVGAKPPGKLAPALRPIPELRKNRQPRTFPATLPDASPAAVRYVWHPAPDAGDHRTALARLAREVTYLGHSHSLVRIEVVDTAPSDDLSDGEAWMAHRPVELRTPYKGRLAELAESHRRSRTENRIVRPTPSLVTHTFQPKEPDPVPSTLFDSSNATAFADDGGFVPALAAFPLVAKRLRDALLDLAPKDAPVPTLVSGHDPDGRPTAEPHIAIVPLADVGWTHSQGRLMGLASVWPREADTEQRRSALRAVAGFVREESGNVGLLGHRRRTTGGLHFGHDGSWSLVLEPESDHASLRFGRYVRPARRWATVLPAALDRHPKDKPGEELAAIVVRACLKIGLPRTAVDGLDVELHKHTAVRGIAAEWSIDRDRVRYALTVPANVTARVAIPVASPDGVRLDGEPIPGDAVLAIASQQGRAVVIEVGSGGWDFEWPLDGA